MVTQFGYVTIWSIVWPLAPIFAFINNYIELRADALKICRHVRRPVGDRVETIGSWLETLVRAFSLGSPCRLDLMADMAAERYIVDRGSHKCHPDLPLPADSRSRYRRQDAEPERPALPRLSLPRQPHLYLQRITNDPDCPTHPHPLGSRRPCRKPRVHYPALDRRGGRREGPMAR